MPSPELARRHQAAIAAGDLVAASALERGELLEELDAIIDAKRLMAGAPLRHSTTEF